jgi:hypothetical protein
MILVGVSVDPAPDGGSAAVLSTRDFSFRCSPRAGATTLLVYRDEVEPYEIGLPEGDGPQRRTLYTCLAFGELRRFARDNSCRTVRAGLGAARPKRIRGARAVTRRCGRPRLMV